MKVKKDGPVRLGRKKKPDREHQVLVYDQVKKKMVWANRIRW